MGDIHEARHSVSVDTIGDAVANPYIRRPRRLSRALYAAARRSAGRWTTPATTRPFWLLSRHADILEVERQPEVF